jgi:hypothetical protein
MGQIAGKGANADTLHQAQCIAEANINLVRIREARQRVLSSYFPLTDIKGLHKDPSHGKQLAGKLAQLAKELITIDQYERRALSRRKFAIRDFDAARRQAATNDATSSSSADRG